MKRILCCLFALLVLCSCAKSEKTGRISEEELSALRDQYPFNDAVSSLADGIPSYMLYPTFEALLGKNEWHIGSDICAAVVVKPVGSWYEISDTVLPYDDEELNNIVLEKSPSIANITWRVRDVKIEKVLWGGEDLKKADTITLGFGAGVVTGGQGLETVFRVGDRFVCFLIDWRNRDTFNSETLFVTSKDHLFYVTKDDVVLSVTSVAGADEVSGLYLNSFETLVNEILSPVEPELQTE